LHQLLPGQLDIGHVEPGLIPNSIVLSSLAITFKDGSTTLGTAALNGSGQASISISTLGVGSHSITAVYSGDPNYATSTGTTTQLVTKVTTSFTASATPPSVPYGATSSLAESGLPSGATGTVTFSSGSTTLCTATLPATSCPTSSALPAGIYAVTSTYSGDSTYSGSTASTNLTVTPATTSTTVTSSQNPAGVGQPVTYTATVKPNPGGGTVAFTDNGATISGCSADPSDPATDRATCSTTYSSAGSHTIAAAYGGNANFQGSTSPTGGVDALTETVQSAVPTPVTGAGARGGSGWEPWVGGLAVLVGMLLGLGAQRRRRRRSTT
jgi:hypothetical protein